MLYQWRFPDDVCGNSDDVWVHAVVIGFTLYTVASIGTHQTRIPLLLFALLEFTHAYGHYVGSGSYIWMFVHYMVVITAYSIKPAPLRVLVPFLCVDIIGHLMGNDMVSIGTTMAFAATRFDSTYMRRALAITYVLFAFMELVACEWSGGHLHEGWDMGLALAMMAGVRWYACIYETGGLTVCSSKYSAG
jgi:hypothetical protein